MKILTSKSRSAARAAAVSRAAAAALWALRSSAAGGGGPNTALRKAPRSILGTAGAACRDNVISNVISNHKFNNLIIIRLHDLLHHHII